MSKPKLKWDAEKRFYRVILDGAEIGTVNSYEERTARMSGRIAVGYSYRTVWSAYALGRRVGYAFRTRRDAVSALATKVIP